MLSGPGTVLPNLPPRPNCQNHGEKIVEKTIQKQPEQLQKENQARITPVKPTWATVTQTDIHTPAAPVKDVRVHVGNEDTECCERKGPPFLLVSRHDLVCM